jgi:16S rRNA (cytidine1402-2'-O)-methyltransferase
MGKLIIVPTPIGNLEDITIRAIRMLKEVDLVLAEDTRVTRKLFSHYDIHTSLKAFHQHNEHQLAGKLAEELKEDKTFALVSDAGTPGISDPAYLIVKACLEQNIEVECLPGATAFVPALVKSGLPASSFCFEGFLPQKKGRLTKLNSLLEEERTMIFYESPFRVIKTLEQFITTFGPQRKASVSRELTKLFEETVNGTLEEILEYYQKHTLKGEFVIVIAGKN